MFDTDPTDSLSHSVSVLNLPVKLPGCPVELVWRTGGEAVAQGKHKRTRHFTAVQVLCEANARWRGLHGQPEESSGLGRTKITGITVSARIPIKSVQRPFA